MDDPFWNVYYPPNHFKCRSTVRQRSGTYTTPDHKIEQAEIPPMFRTNLAKNGLVFPNEHPYWKDMPEEYLNMALNVQIKEIKDWAKNNLLGTTVKVSKIGDVGFNNTAIKEFLNQPHVYKLDKNKILYNIKDVLKSATYIDSSPDIKGNKMVKCWHYLEILLKGAKSYIVVRELVTGEKILYSIVESLKRK